MNVSHLDASKGRAIGQQRFVSFFPLESCCTSNKRYGEMISPCDALLETLATDQYVDKLTTGQLTTKMETAPRTKVLGVASKFHAIGSRLIR